MLKLLKGKKKKNIYIYIYISETLLAMPRNYWNKTKYIWLPNKEI